MRRKQFSEDQIVRILEEFEQGKSVEELCREYNVPFQKNTPTIVSALNSRKMDNELAQSVELCFHL